MRGFTLIEIIVVIAIMSAMFAFLFVNFRGKDNIRFLDNKANTILSDLQRLQTMSLSGELVNGLSPKYYFLRFSGCDSGCSNYQLEAKMPDNLEVIIENVALARILITIVQGAPTGAVDINFYPPRGTIKISSDEDLLVLKIAHLTNNLIFKYIKINSVSGRLDISPNQ